MKLSPLEVDLLLARESLQRATGRATKERFAEQIGIAPECVETDRFKIIIFVWSQKQADELDPRVRYFAPIHATIEYFDVHTETAGPRLCQAHPECRERPPELTHEAWIQFRGECWNQDAIGKPPTVEDAVMARMAAKAIYGEGISAQAIRPWISRYWAEQDRIRALAFLSPFPSDVPPPADPHAHGDRAPDGAEAGRTERE